MYEHHTQPLLKPRDFFLRLVRHFGVALLVIVPSLGMGVAGYHFSEDLGWLDSLLNASMILSGMGPVSELKTSSGKLFAGFYAIFSGLFVVIATGFVLAPVLHRVLHSFHVEEGKEADD